MLAPTMFSRRRPMLVIADKLMNRTGLARPSLDWCIKQLSPDPCEGTGPMNGRVAIAGLRPRYLSTPSLGPLTRRASKSPTVRFCDAEGCASSQGIGPSPAGSLARRCQWACPASRVSWLPGHAI